MGQLAPKHFALGATLHVHPIASTFAPTKHKCRDQNRCKNINKNTKLRIMIRVRRFRVNLILHFDKELPRFNHSNEIKDRCMAMIYVWDGFTSRIGFVVWFRFGLGFRSRRWSDKNSFDELFKRINLKSFVLTNTKDKLGLLNYVWSLCIFDKTTNEMLASVLDENFWSEFVDGDYFLFRYYFFWLFAVSYN